jgi:hypothetical protein
MHIAFEASSSQKIVKVKQKSENIYVDTLVFLGLMEEPYSSKVTSPFPEPLSI